MFYLCYLIFMSCEVAGAWESSDDDRVWAAGEEQEGTGERAAGK